MKDGKVVIGFIALGLVVAFIFSGPLRKPAPQTAQIGTVMDENTYVEGVVSVADALKANLDQTPFLFVIARPLGQKAGPPLAVKRYERPRYPFQFALAQRDNMVGEDFYAGDLSITIRLDGDGLAMPQQAVDIQQVVDIKADGDRTVEVSFP